MCTDHFDRSVGFFRDVMGLRLREQGVPRVDVQFARYCVFDSGNNLMLELFEPKPEIAGRYSGPILSFTVADLDGAREEMKGHVTFLTDVIDDHSSWRWIYFRAPDGNVYQVQERRK